MQLSKSFYSEEFLCPCGKCDGGGMKSSFIEKLQKLRDILAVPVIINSGFRCADHNSSVGGEKDSQHMSGNAADIHVYDGAIGYAVQAAAYQVGFKGIALKRKSGEEGIVHVDDRPTTAVAWSY